VKLEATKGSGNGKFLKVSSPVEVEEEKKKKAPKVKQQHSMQESHKTRTSSVNGEILNQIG
jgi:hypothetical protein